MNPDPQHAYRDMLQRIRTLGRTWKRLRLMEALLRWIAQIALASGLLVLIDRAFPIGELPWAVLVMAGALWILWGAYRHPLRAALMDTSVPHVAARIDQTHPGSENRILSAIELWPEEPRAHLGYSQHFIRQLMEQAHALVRDLDPTVLFREERRRLTHALRWAAGTLLFSFGLLILFPESGRHVLHALDTFHTLPEQLTNVQIAQVEPGDVQILARDDVTVRARVVGYTEKPVRLRLLRGTEAADTLPESARSDYPMQPTGDGWYTATLHDLTESVRYLVSVAEVTSPTYRITVRHPPQLNRLQLTLHLPEYTELAPQLLEPGEGNVQALVGTRVEIEGQSTRPLATASLEFASERSLPLDVEGDQIHGEFTVRSNDRYRILLQDVDGLANPAPVEYVVRALEDEIPRVEVLEPGRDVVLDERMMVSLNVLAQDDYGLTRAELVYTHEGTGETTRVPLPLETAGPLVSIRYDWDLDPLGLFPEDVVSYFVEVWDSDTVGGPKSGRSATYRVRHPSLADLYRSVDARQEEERGVMEEILGEQEEAAGTLDDVIDRLRKTQELTWKEKKTVEQVRQMQEQIQTKAQELVQQLKQTAEEMQKKQLFDEQTIQKYLELQKLMDEALTEEQKQILQKLREALENQRLDEQERRLLEANFKQEEFRQRLERLVELYKQLLTQQRLEALARQAKALYEQQKATTETIRQLAASPRPDERAMQEAARREERIAKQLGDLHQEMDAVADEIRQLPNQERVAQEIDRLRQESQDRGTQGNLQQAGRQLTQKNPSQAVPMAQQATQAMRDLQQGLDNALEFMQGANAEQALAAMQSAVEEGLQLSQRHERLFQQVRQLAQNVRGEPLEGELRRIRDLATRQLSVAQGVGILADRLWKLGKEQMLIDPKIVWTLRAAQDELSRSVQALEDRKPSSALPMQQQALTDLNRSVRDLLNAIDQMNQQMSLGGLQSMLEQLEQLAEDQSQLNEMAQQLSEQMRRQGRTPRLEQMLKRMAYEQSLIREATERLAENMKRFNQLLGDLQEVAEEMQEVERALEQGQLDEQVLEKQRRILTRMLESTKSLKKRQTSKERKSETAADTTQNKAAEALDPDLTVIQKRLEENVRATAPETWPAIYREQIRNYYRALSRQVRPAKERNQSDGQLR